MGKSGAIAVSLTRFMCLHETEEHIIDVAIDSDGNILPNEFVSKIMTLKSSIKETTEDVLHKNTLDALIDTTSKGINTEVNERNKKFIDEESAKITRWAEDQTYALEQELRDIKKRIKEKERIFKSESDGTLRLSIQKEIQTLQRQMKKKRQELFNLEDEIEEERDRLIEKIEASLEQTITKETLFIINWTIK